MKYFSLNDPHLKVSFREAVILGQAPGKSLYFPDQIPLITAAWLESLKSRSKEEIALKIIQPYIEDEIPKSDLLNIISETINFDFPLVKVEENIYCLELFHGPTCAFKDVGARFLSGCLNYFSKGQDKKITILVATSGDTGGAVADAFYGSENVDVIILYPAGKVSHWQELQLTTYGKNVRAICVEGSFDDCQALVKEAFSDPVLKKKYSFNSANSINIARWLSQQFYYFFALKQWPFDMAPDVSVPSGNLGNLAAGMLAKKSGSNIDTLIAACNENDVLVDYLECGEYIMKKAIPTVSNAMDVGAPSNFPRVIELLKKDKNHRSLTGYSFTSDETKKAIHDVYQQTKYTMDPHSAVGYLALKKHFSHHSKKAGFFLGTAHPAKFFDIVNPLVGEYLEVPTQIQSLQKKQVKKENIPARYDALKELLTG